MKSDGVTLREKKKWVRKLLLNETQKEYKSIALAILSYWNNSYDPSIFMWVLLTININIMKARTYPYTESLRPRSTD